MGWEFNEHQVRPNVHYWSPKAHKERNEVKTRREQAQKAYDEAKVCVDARVGRQILSNTLKHRPTTQQRHVALNPNLVSEFPNG